MCSNIELKNDIEKLRQEQETTRSLLRYISDDVGWLKEETKKQIKYNKKQEIKLAEREQFFIDAVIEMKELMAEMRKIIIAGEPASLPGERDGKTS